MSLANLTSAKKKTPAPEPQPYDGSMEDVFTVSDADLGTDSLDEFFVQEREAPPHAHPDTGADGPQPLEDEHTERSRSWFERAFGSDDDGPEEMDVEMSDEMYTFTADAASDITDIAFSNVNSTLHADDDVEKHQATEDKKAKVARAWELYARWKKMVMTPGTYLVWTIFMVYGFGTIFGLLKYANRIRVYGFHWPWSDKWKVTAAEMGHFQQPVEPQPEHVQQPEPVAVAPQPQMSQQPAKPDAKEPMAEEVKTAGDNVEWEPYRCLQTDNPIRKGEGVPKTSKNHPEIVGKFIDHTARMQYFNKMGWIGSKAKSE